MVLVHLLAVAELVLPPSRAPVKTVFAPSIKTYQTIQTIETDERVGINDSNKMIAE